MIGSCGGESGGWYQQNIGPSGGGTSRSGTSSRGGTSRGRGNGSRGTSRGGTSSRDGTSSRARCTQLTSGIRECWPGQVALPGAAACNPEQKKLISHQQQQQQQSSSSVGEQMPWLDINQLAPSIQGGHEIDQSIMLWGENRLCT